MQDQGLRSGSIVRAKLARNDGELNHHLNPRQLSEWKSWFIPKTGSPILKDLVPAGARLHQLMVVVECEWQHHC
jgi:hypothetical protein